MDREVAVPAEAFRLLAGAAGTRADCPAPTELACYVRPPFSISSHSARESVHNRIMADERDLERTQGTREQETTAISNPGRTPGPPATNPFSVGRTGTTGGTGHVNPSGPSTGTEAWGIVDGESKTTGTGQGQLGSASRGNAAGLEHTEREELPISERTFRCADAGNADCQWETSARTEDELMDNIERHGREAHGIRSFDEDSRRRFINAIRERRTA